MSICSGGLSISALLLAFASGQNACGNLSALLEPRNKLHRNFRSEKFGRRRKMFYLHPA
jgi:hypothetical protein